MELENPIFLDEFFYAYKLNHQKTFVGKIRGEVLGWVTSEGAAVGSQ